MGKRDPLPKLEEYLAPWEVDSDGKPIPEEEQKIDTARLKKYLHNVLGDRHKLQTDYDAEKARADELEQKVADAPDPAKLSELQQEVTKTRQERDEARQKAEKDGEASLEVLRYKVALKKGLTEVQARRLLGKSEEELEQDADELLASFGGGKNAQTGDDGDDGGDTVRRGPRRVFQVNGDPGAGAGNDPEEKEIDPDKWAAEVYARRRR